MSPTYFCGIAVVWWNGRRGEPNILLRNCCGGVEKALGNLKETDLCGIAEAGGEGGKGEPDILVRNCCGVGEGEERTRNARKERAGGSGWEWEEVIRSLG